MSKTFTATLGLMAAFALTAFANDFDKKTVITIDQPILVAGVRTVTLQPGTYVLRLMNQSANRNIVEILNQRENHLYALVLALPTFRTQAKDKSDIRFWETPAGDPVALQSWFYPGDQWGQEFVYPKGVARKIAQETGEPVLAVPPAKTPEQLEQAPVSEINKAGEEQPLQLDEYTLEEIAGANPPAQPATVVANPPVEAKSADEPPELDEYTREEIGAAYETPEAAPPKAEGQVALPLTGSPYYLFGAAGILFAAAGLGLKLAAVRTH